MVDFKVSLAKEIVSFHGTQPHAHLQRDGGTSMQCGHHLHTSTISHPRGFLNGEGCHISQYSVVI